MMQPVQQFLTTLKDDYQNSHGFNRLGLPFSELSMEERMIFLSRKQLPGDFDNDSSEEQFSEVAEVIPFVIEESAW